MTQHHVGSVSVRALLSPPPPPSPLSLRPGIAAMSLSPFLRDVGWPFSVGWGLHTKGGPSKVSNRTG